MPSAQQWERAWCSKYQRWYYQNRKTGVSTWERPDSFVEAESTAPAAVSSPWFSCGSLPWFSCGWCPCRRRCKRQSDIEDAEQPEELPTGWDKAWDSRHQQVYFYNLETRERTWSPPTGATTSTLTAEAALSGSVSTQNAAVSVHGECQWSRTTVAGASTTCSTNSTAMHGGLVQGNLSGDHAGEGKGTNLEDVRLEINFEVSDSNNSVKMRVETSTHLSGDGSRDSDCDGPRSRSNSYATIRETPPRGHSQDLHCDSIPSRSTSCTSGRQVSPLLQLQDVNKQVGELHAVAPPLPVIPALPIFQKSTDSFPNKSDAWFAGAESISYLLERARLYSKKRRWYCKESG